MFSPVDSSLEITPEMHPSIVTSHPRSTGLKQNYPCSTRSAAIIWLRIGSYQKRARKSWPRVFAWGKVLQGMLEPRWVPVLDGAGMLHCYIREHGHVGVQITQLVLLSASSHSWRQLRSNPRSSQCCHPRTWCSWAEQHSDNKDK